MAHILLERTHNDFLRGKLVVQGINWTLTFHPINPENLPAPAGNGMPWQANGSGHPGMADF